VGILVLPRPDVHHQGRVDRNPVGVHRVRRPLHVLVRVAPLGGPVQMGARRSVGARRHGGDRPAVLRRIRHRQLRRRAEWPRRALAAIRRIAHHPTGTDATLWHLFTLDPGPWTLDPGPWTLDPGPWTLDTES